MDFGFKSQQQNFGEIRMFHSKLEGNELPFRQEKTRKWCAQISANAIKIRTTDSNPVANNGNVHAQCIVHAHAHFTSLVVVVVVVIVVVVVVRRLSLLSSHVSTLVNCISNFYCTHDSAGLQDEAMVTRHDNGKGQNGDRRHDGDGRQTPARVSRATG